MTEIKIVYVGLGLVAIALAMIFSKSIEATSRNSEAAGRVMTMSMIAAAFIELIALLIIFLQLTAK